MAHSAVASPTRPRNGTRRAYETFGSVTRAIQPFLDSERDHDYLTELHELAARCGSAASPRPGASINPAESSSE